MTDEEYEKMKKFMSDQIKEVEIHKWIESEKANRDLGEEAIKDWIIKHAAEFRKKWEEENSQKDEK
jgi:midasin (ATPase involved in ribosome maturation)